MTALIAFLVWALAIAVVIPALMLALETIASFFPHKHRSGAAQAPPVVVVMPAHNEGAHMIPTLEDLRGELGPADRLIVIADNCTDDTAALARARGAEVLARDEPARRGKGYALQFAIDHLKTAPPPYIAFFDADCRIEKGALGRLARLAAAYQRPSQALYLMRAPEGKTSTDAVAAFAWVMINRVRMTGLSNLADVTRFTGVGLVAPWDAVAGLDFAAAGITEDLALSVEMSGAGAAPFFAPDAVVTSVFPGREDARVTQSARWEHGSVGVLARLAFPSLARALVARDFRAAMLALDALIPPMAAFAVMLLLGVVLAALAAPIVGPGPLALLGSALGLFVLSIGGAWIVYGREALPAKYLIGLAPFLWRKLRVYGRQGRKSSRTWTRTDRNGPANKR